MIAYYLFKFNQQREDRVRRNADRYGIEVISPKVTQWRKAGKARKPQPVHVAAFHSYLILGFEPDQLFVALTKLHRSVRPLVVPFNGSDWTLARVPEREIEAIRENRLFKGGTARDLVSEVVPDPKYTKSECVRILGGAATGLEGKVISADPVMREAELDMEGWPVKLTVSYDLLERAA